ncbi:hypothetical protein BDR26DRAFT_890183 [Obelidium mucronatum]|nr:hypothetical protein BDR26DRAFT_890183 [Obelidium mucronatum]
MNNNSSKRHQVLILSAVTIHRLIDSNLRSSGSSHLIFYGVGVSPELLETLVTKEESEDEEDFKDADSVAIGLSDVASSWALDNGESVSKTLMDSAIQKIKDTAYKTMSAIEKYSISLSLSSVLNPDCEKQVQLLNLSNPEQETFLLRARSLSSVDVPNLPEFESVKSVLRLCRHGNTMGARIKLKKSLGLVLEQLQELDVGDVGFDEKVVEWKILTVYEHIYIIIYRPLIYPTFLNSFSSIELLSMEPDYFLRGSLEPPPSEHEIVDVIRKIVSVLSRDCMTVRVGELGACDLPTGTRRKVDLTLASPKTGCQLSHSEFARFSNSERKRLADQSKIIRLNQTILNKNRCESTIGLQQCGLIGTLILLKHVDHGLYIVNSNTQFVLPSKISDIHVNMPDLIQKLSFYVASVRFPKGILPGVENVPRPAQPFWTNRTKKK